MLRPILLLALTLPLLAGCQEAASPGAASIARPAATGPRWVALKAPGLTCESCAAQVREELEHVAGISKIEMFAPNPYCRFYVEDGHLDVTAMLDEIAARSAGLDGYSFVRGG